jgi:hypothetical protein
MQIAFLIRGMGVMNLIYRNMHLTAVVQLLLFYLLASDQKRTDKYMLLYHQE